MQVATTSAPPPPPPPPLLPLPGKQPFCRIFLKLMVITTHHQKAKVGILKESSYVHKALAVSQAVMVVVVAVETKRLPSVFFFIGSLSFCFYALFMILTVEVRPLSLSPRYKSVQWCTPSSLLF